MNKVINKDVVYIANTKSRYDTNWLNNRNFNIIDSIDTKNLKDCSIINTSVLTSHVYPSILERSEDDLLRIVGNETLIINLNDLELDNTEIQVLTNFNDKFRNLIILTNNTYDEYLLLKHSLDVILFEYIDEFEEGE